jgi:hypothetical protein
MPGAAAGDWRFPHLEVRMTNDVGRSPAAQGRAAAADAVEPVPVSSKASIPNAGARTHLIWSNKWGAWHKRCDDDGHARGYTTDILKAGIFETSTALAYHDEDRNKAIPLAEAIKSLRDVVDEKRQELMSAQMRLVDFYEAASAGEAGTATTTQIGVVHEHATREAGDAR